MHTSKVNTPNTHDNKKSITRLKMCKAIYKEKHHTRKKKYNVDFFN